jgi:voltage-gated potassium channel
MNEHQSTELQAPPRAVQQQRWELLAYINAITDKPMIALSFVWLGLLILDFTQGLGPLLQNLSNVIWVLFVLDFVIEIVIAPHKLNYLRRNWLTAVSLVLPALRVLRVFQALRILRAARAARSLSLVRLLTSLNRGMRAFSRTIGRRGIGYILGLTIIIIFAGAAGMVQFESPRALAEAGHTDVVQAGWGLRSYGEGVWWTAMMMTTMGSEYWPKTAEGRVLGLLLAIYAFTVFGYITATIASHFIGQDREEQPAAGMLGTSEISMLRDEIASLRTQLAALRIELAAQSGHKREQRAAPDNR